jgi:hydroxyethylthiazole kinase-like uncharacterized protein yjeF
MQEFDLKDLKKLYIPPSRSHKGQNGKLLLVSGSKLFHSSSLWALKAASRMLDMVYYSSVDENNKIVEEAKKEFRDGIIVPRNKVEGYAAEANCILIGPGLPREDGIEAGDDDTKILTESLLKKYPLKKWVIDGGSLQVLDPEILKSVNNPILTPHLREFEMLKSKIQNSIFKNAIQKLKLEEQVELFSKKYGCVVVLKGPIDYICEPFGSAQGETCCVQVSGGNAGMTKGGTGDVLASLIASLYCKNEAFLSAAAGSYINKKAGESLFKKVGYYFNSSDLVDEIPRVMKSLILP